MTASVWRSWSFKNLEAQHFASQQYLTRNSPFPYMATVDFHVVRESLLIILVAQVGLKIGMDRATRYFRNSRSDVHLPPFADSDIQRSTHHRS